MPNRRAAEPIKPRRSSGARPTDDHLLDVARTVFAERGYAAASMELIAERADTTKPTLYAHFGSKEGVYRAVIGREVRLLESALAEVYDSVRGETARDQMDQGFGAIMNYARFNKEGGHLLFGAGGPGHAETMVALVGHLTVRVAENIERFLIGIGRTPAPIVPMVARSMVWTAITAVQSADLDDDEDCARKIGVAVTFSRGGMNAMREALFTEAAPSPRASPARPRHGARPVARKPAQRPSIRTK